LVSCTLCNRSRRRSFGSKGAQTQSGALRASAPTSPPLCLQSRERGLAAELRKAEARRHEQGPAAFFQHRPLEAPIFRVPVRQHPGGAVALIGPCTSWRGPNPHVRLRSNCQANLNRCLTLSGGDHHMKTSEHGGAPCLKNPLALPVDRKINTMSKPSHSDFLARRATRVLRCATDAARAKRPGRARPDIDRTLAAARATCLTIETSGLYGPSHPTAAHLRDVYSAAQQLRRRVEPATAIAATLAKVRMTAASSSPNNIAGAELRRAISSSWRRRGADLALITLSLGLGIAPVPDPPYPRASAEEQR